MQVRRENNCERQRQCERTERQREKERALETKTKHKHTHKPIHAPGAHKIDDERRRTVTATATNTYSRTAKAHKLKRKHHPRETILSLSFVVWVCVSRVFPSIFFFCLFRAFNHANSSSNRDKNWQGKQKIENTH